MLDWERLHMNERYFELIRKCSIPADQAEDYQNANALIDPQLKLDIAKYTESIIEEACQAFWSEACHVSDLAYDEYYRNSKKIKQHFGVTYD